MSGACSETKKVLNTLGMMESRVSPARVQSGVEPWIGGSLVKERNAGGSSVTKLCLVYIHVDE